MEHLYEKLMEYSQGPDYPFHMPGHKRQIFGGMPREAYRMDITEIDGFDNLHEPEEILLDLQKRIAGLYGAEESFCLVNGSTGGILSAVSAAVPMGGKILMARNCHKSAYHAAYLRRLQICYLTPPVMEEYGIFDAVTPEQVRKALEQEPDAAAVLLVSPTYEGRIAQIREIAQIVHAYGRILIVDEAHGAHLGLCNRENSSAFPEFRQPQNSCRAGADLVIHSVHKTLPAMTQTALLHVNGDRVDRERLRRFCRIYQSSSPSYVLMASIDNAVSLVEEQGEKLFSDFYCEFYEMMQNLQKCRHLKILGTDLNGTVGSCVNPGVQDVGKLLIFAGDSGYSGRELYDILREKYHLQPEMAAGDFCLAMLTIADTPEGFSRLQEALLQIDREAGGKAGSVDYDEKNSRIRGNKTEEISSLYTGAGKSFKEQLPVCGLSFAQAWDLPWEEVPLKECSGRLAAEFINLYPPGFPLLVPGEQFDEALCERLAEYLAQGLNVQGVNAENGTVKCIKAGV